MLTQGNVPQNEKHWATNIIKIPIISKILRANEAGNKRQYTLYDST